MKGLFNLSQTSLGSIRIYYLIIGGSSALFSPFINLFFNRQGLSGTQIGIINGVAAILAMAVAPWWTSTSQNAGRPRFILQGISLVSALLTLLLGFQSVFIWILIIMAVRSLVTSASSPMSDTMVLRVLGSGKAGFGSVRLYSSIGWAVLVVAGGWLMGFWGLGVAFWGFALLTLVSVFVLNGVAEGSHVAVTQDEEPSGEKVNFKNVVKGLTQNRAMVGLALMMAVMVFCMSGVNQFENVFVYQLGGNEFVIGIVNMVGAVVEVPSMLWADRLVRRSNGRSILMISMLGYILLRGIVFYFPSVGMIILTRALGGLVFSLYTVGLMHTISEQIPHHRISTVLAIYIITLPGLINFVATPTAGYLFDVLGGKWLYLIGAAGYLLGWLCLWLSRTPKKNLEVTQI